MSQLRKFYNSSMLKWFDDNNILMSSMLSQ